MKGRGGPVMRSLAAVLLFVALTGCAAPQTDLGQWAKAKGEQLRRLNEHPIYQGPHKFRNNTRRQN
jgi:hypothetical protein